MAPRSLPAQCDAAGFPASDAATYAEAVLARAGLLTASLMFIAACKAVGSCGRTYALTRTGGRWPVIEADHGGRVGRVVGG